MCDSLVVVQYLKKLLCKLCFWFYFFSDGHTDWNTDCGIFDSRGPPGSTFRSQQLPDTHYQSFIPRRVRGRSAPFSERNTNCVDHRSRWRRASPHRHSNTSRCRHCSSIRSNHFNTYNGTDYRHRLHCHRYDESHENPNYFYSSRCIEDNLWSERISGLSGSSCSSEFSKNLSLIVLQYISATRNQISVSIFMLFHCTAENWNY